MSNTLPQLRRIRRWRVDPPFRTIEMTTSIDVEKELWLLLNYISEVKSAAEALFLQFNIDKKIFDNTWLKFRAFIRQANNYWEVATKANFRSSSLLYYYSFLNLIKAFILLKRPDLPEKVSHGIYYGKDYFPRDLIDKYLVVNLKDDQIFRLFYKEIFQTEPARKFKIIDLFGYSEDITYQYLECGLGNLKVFPVIHRVCFDNSEKKSWSVLAIPKYISKIILDKNFPKFAEYFEFVSIPAADLNFRDIFQFRKLDWTSLDFYQFSEERVINLEHYSPLTATNYGVIDCNNILKEIFGVLLESNYLPNGDSFYVTLPVCEGDQKVPMNELVAIYLIMFFMSELVRYQADYLDNVLENKESWLFRSFVESCPLKFLRAITSKVKNQTIVMERI